MKNYLPLLVFSILSLTTLNAQEPASGTIEFEASNNSGSVDVELVGAQAQSLETSDIYNIDGITNEVIPFNWEVLGLDEFSELYSIYINPSGAFDGIFSNPLGSTFDVGIYNMLGQRISTSKITYNDNHVNVYDGLEGVSDGMYMVNLIGSGGESESIRFIKKGWDSNRTEIIFGDEVINKNRIKENPFGQRMVDNYNIIWEDGYGVESGSQSVSINAGSGNVLDITTSTLENPYYTVNGSITGGTNGTATYDTDDGDQYTAPITGTTFTLTDITSQFDNVNAVDDVFGDLTLQGSYGTFQSALDLTTDGEGEIIVNLGEYNVGGSSGTGNLLITPTFDGGAESGFICTITNTETNQSFQEISTNGNSVFWIDLPIETLPTDTYNGIIVDSDADPMFLPTNFNFTLSEGSNSEIVPLNLIPNEQDIAMVVRDSDDLQLVEGATVHMLEADLILVDLPGSAPDYYRHNNLSTDTVLESAISDGNGEIIFQDIPGESDIYFRVFKEDYYITTKTFYRVPEVNRVSKMDTLLNITIAPKRTYWDNTAATADTLMYWNPRYMGINSEFVLGHMKIYLNPNWGDRQETIEHLDSLAEHIGFPGAFQYYDTPFPENLDPYYPDITLWDYNPYPDNRNVLDGLVGCNLYRDGSSNQGIGWVRNGYFYDFINNTHATWNFNESNFRILHHELGHAMGVPHVPDGFFDISPMVFGAPLGHPPNFFGSKYDTAALNLWFTLGKLHYDTVDGQGRLIDYAMTLRIDDYEPGDFVNDDDNDGVINFFDNCPGTPPSEPVDVEGCSESQLDDDNDGVPNNIDLCPDTPYGTEVDEFGCPL